MGRRRDTPNRQQIYRRELPGGGYVAIEVARERTFLGRRRYRGILVVERRCDSARRVGHAPPDVASVRAAAVASTLHELFPLAQSNCAVAAALVRRHHV